MLQSQSLNPKCQTAKGTAASNSIESATTRPSRVKRPAANKAMTVDAIEPEVGMTSITGMNSVRDSTSKSGTYIHGGWIRNVHRGRSRRSTQ